MDAYSAYMQGNQEGRSHLIGPSGVSKCYRQHAYRYMGVEPTDEVSTAKADLGTLFHLGWSEMLRRSFDPEERRGDVRIRTKGMPRDGEADDVDFANRRVTDLKTTSSRVYDMWCNSEPYESYWDQLAVYALGLHQQYGGEWTLVIHGFDVETGRHGEWERVQDVERAQALVDRAAFRHQQLTAAGAMTAAGALPLEVVEQFPREGKGPGLGMPCDWCPWLSQCWPEPSSEDGTPQSETIRDDADEVGRYASEYMEAAAEARKADGRKRDAQAFLKGLDGEYPGPDGGTFRVTTVGGKSKQTPDCAAMEERLTELGEPIPMKWTKSASYPRVNRKK